MAARRGRSEDCIYCDYTAPCRGPDEHRRCAGSWRGVVWLGYGPDGRRIRRKGARPGQDRGAQVPQVVALPTGPLSARTQHPTQLLRITGTAMLEVDEAIIEPITSYGSDCGGNCGVAGRPPREPRRERDQQATVVPARSDVLAAEPGEVTDILSQQRISPVSRSRENVGIGPARHPELSHRGGIDALIPQYLRELHRQHLIEEKLHRASAAAVS
jgi:hypothetical protein